MPILSSNPLWEAFGLRALPYSLYGSADLGGCVSTTDRVGEGTADDWYREWIATADRIARIAKQSEQRGHLISAREAYLRAATYYHVSYFPLFGFPVDPRLSRAFEAEVTAFGNAADLLHPAVEQIEIPFDGQSLPGYFVSACQARERAPTIVHVNGYDSNIQEMYFAHGPAATRRGYSASPKEVEGIAKLSLARCIISKCSTGWTKLWPHLLKLVAGEANCGNWAPLASEAFVDAGISILETGILCDG